MTAFEHEICLYEDELRFVRRLPRTWLYSRDVNGLRDCPIVVSRDRGAVATKSCASSSKCFLCPIGF